MRSTKTILISLLLIFSFCTFSQKVENVHFEQQGKTIVVYYNLTGTQEGNYSVSLFFSEDDGKTWQGPLLRVKGAVGENQKPGTDKMITWDVLTERTKLLGEVQFEIRAQNDVFGFEMVFVQGGTFLMGRNDGEFGEKPVHSVTLNDFYIGKFEVTQKQWRDVMGGNPSYFQNCDNCPVEQVSWSDIQKFINKLNQITGKPYRLPTEAEWEYAATGGNNNNGYAYSGSNNVSDVAWFSENSGSKTHPVGQKQPNELGIYDMSGNVWEWCNDWYDEKYYNYGPSNNPRGPGTGKYRVLRGGSWGYGSSGCLAKGRSGTKQGNQGNSGGLRLAKAKKNSL